MCPVPWGATEPAPVDRVAVAMASGTTEATGSEDSAAPLAETLITAPIKSMTLEALRLKLLRPTVGRTMSERFCSAILVGGFILPVGSKSGRS